MSTKMEAPHVAEYSSYVSGLKGRTSFIGSRIERHKSARGFSEEKRPQAYWTRQLYEHMPDAVFLMTGDNRISACNGAAVTLFGYEEDELLGRKIGFIWSVTPNVQLRGRWAHQGAVRAGLATTKTGVQFPTALTIIRKQNEKETFAVAIFEDFRTERDTLRQVQELQRELERLARTATLGEMTATLAHELSQPLSSIAAYSEGCGRLVMNGRRQHGEELRAALSEITQNALWAGTIIQNIREFAKRGSREQQLVSMHALIHEAAKFALAGLSGKGRHIELQFHAGQDTVLADRVQIVQVLINLLHNAVEATDGVEQPMITIHTRAECFSHLAVDVSDNGCGIGAEIEAALFRPFVTNKPRGLGMGLALSKRIIGAHGGHISARKGTQGGSVLSFSLPLAENTIDDK